MNLATNAVLIFIDWHVHLSGLEVVVEAQDIPAWLRLKSGTVEFKSTSMILKNPYQALSLAACHFGSHGGRYAGGRGCGTACRPEATVCALGN